MKFFAVFACVIAVAVASPTSWTLSDLSDAITNPNTDKLLIPILENALNIVMDKIFAGESIESVQIQTAAGVSTTFQLAELDYTIAHSSPIVQPYLKEALDHLMDSIWQGQDVDSIAVLLPALELSHWTLQELDSALSSADTNPAMVPYLENALNDLMSSLFAGSAQTFVTIATPVEINAPEVALVPSPAAVAEAAPALVGSSNSALVQIILNVAKTN